MPRDLVEIVRDAGVVGAGGAGFPTWKKIDVKVDTVIANGAECEPLLFKDVTLMERYPREIVAGMRAVMKHTGAGKGLFAIKGKNKTAVAAVREHLPDDIRLFEMEDVYPAGDEYEVVFHGTGKRIPAGGYPHEIGIVVQNVETFYNIHQATLGRPVLNSMISAHGAVKQPIVGWFPVGTPYKDVLAEAGGATIDDYVLLDGGPMMGKVVDDLNTPVTRTSAGFIVVPRESHVAVRKSQPEKAYRRVGKSVCDQCSLCTEMCPRYLMGYPIKPHLVMRSLLTTGEMSKTLTHWAQACCECNICSLWACPEELDPRNICATTKRDLRNEDRWLSPQQLQELTTEPHPLKDYRNVPTARLAQRLGLNVYKGRALVLEEPFKPSRVEIPLRQHIGALPQVVVNKGDKVRRGDVIARPANGAFSITLHASIDGTVQATGESILIET